MLNNALSAARILLPAEHVDPAKWAVIACDQFTSQPRYWQETESVVGTAPSTLRLTLPEIFLPERLERMPGIRATMQAYLADGTLTEAVNGFVLVERETTQGTRLGLTVALDLDAYDFTAGSSSLIRATEGTVASRVPPRAEIRSGAPIELPHVMMLIDDPAYTVIEALYARRDTLRPLYDFDLMQGGGHIRGWAVENDDIAAVSAAIDALAENAGGLLYAVGDGNHSLAAAKTCWLQVSEGLSEAEREDHPARFALVELVNLNSPALVFEPIHRVLFNADLADLNAAWRSYLAGTDAKLTEGNAVRFVTETAEAACSLDCYALPVLQPFLDRYVAEHDGVEIDYVHGETDVRDIVAENKNAVGILLSAFDKSELFPSIRKFGVLPRKTFSMGEANDKRYYMEARRIRL